MMMNSLKFGKVLMFLFAGLTSTIYSQETKVVVIDEINGIWLDDGFTTKDSNYEMVESTEFEVKCTIMVDLEKMNGKIKFDGMFGTTEKIEIKENDGEYWLDYIDRSAEKKELKLGKIIELTETTLTVHYQEHDLIQFYSRGKD